MIGLDTTAVIDIFKGDSAIKKLLEKTDGPFLSTIMNYQELMFGLDITNSKHMKEKEFYDNFFEEVVMLSYVKECAVKASDIFWGLKKDGKDIGRFDCMVAGILLLNGVNKIITRNVKHFDNVKGLKVIGY